MSMPTPEGKLIPKNYIKSTINKNLLTPCRRVGLSRSKKTPKNTLESPLQKETTPLQPKCNAKETPKSRGLESNLDKNAANDLLHPKSDIQKIIQTSRKEAIVHSRVHSETPKQRLDLKPTNANQIAVETKSQSRNKSSHFPDCAEDSTPKRPLPKCNKELNNLLTNPNLIHEDNKPCREKVAPDSLVVKPEYLPEQVELDSPVVPAVVKPEKVEPDSPVVPPVVSKVKVQIHEPSAKRNIDFRESKKSVIKNVTKASDEGKKDKPHIQTEVTNTAIIKEAPQEESLSPKLLSNIKNKRKLRLDSDDFSSDDNEPLVKICRKPEIKCHSRKNLLESNENSQSSSQKHLTRFTTEEYLKEYSENPQKFRENFGAGSSSSTFFDDELDDDFVTSMLVVKHKKNTPKIKKEKPYEGILCPIEVSKFQEPSNAPNTSKTHKTLTVSLERISRKRIKESENIRSTKSEKRTSIPNAYVVDDNSEDDMFVCSPESDKKERENLLQLIADIEKEIKSKEDALESLKRAQLYKKKHDPIVLSKSSEKWMEGCRSGLKDLLRKMQEHAPMDMDLLIQKLKIPDDIVTKLNL